ncbi:uncharacterized protein LOC108090031 [Drosophila ficusphila]|uniref:uncharacterized protein LOC108090031 n=1 Tax=Drosophila ficusphila TaxID=30025 RepID=UPI0007E6A921|nr:uncharacterized protein LOC108090031 [Drosophila ficusphila]
MKLFDVLFAVLAVVLMTAIPAFGSVVPQCPTGEEAAQSGGYQITSLSRNAQRPVPGNYNTGRRH